MNLDELVLDPDSFKEVKPIGSGQFGIVRLVQDKKNPKINYALKQIPEESQDSDSQKLFVREVLTLFALSHPAILRLSGFSMPTPKDKSFYLFTEFMPNGNLKELKTREKNGNPNPLFTPTKKTICAIGIAAGMKFVHERKIMHRDLKPENIFFDENFFPKIADFGLARLYEGVGRVTSNLGTPYFMAPELFDDGEITQAIDIYAFAVVLLSMFDPDFKFDSPKQPKNLSQLVNHIKNHRRFVFPKDILEPYKKLIKRCWSTDPKERPPFAVIYEELTSGKKYYFPGTDDGEVNDYIQRITEWEENQKLEGKNNEEEEEEEETQDFNF